MDEEHIVDLTDTILAHRDREEDDSFRDHVREVLSGHKILHTPQTKSWFVGKKKDWNYAFRVVWLPGNLHFSGDLDEVTFTHYHAMPTWVEAVDWVSRADFHYLMEKSTAEKKFVQQKTVVEFLRQAEDLLVNCGVDTHWKKIFEYLDGFFVMGTTFDATDFSVDDPEARKIAIDFMIEEAYTDFTPETVYNITSDPDWTGFYEYNPQAVWQYNGMRHWAALVKETEEYKRETEEQCTKNSEAF